MPAALTNSAYFPFCCGRGRDLDLTPSQQQDLHDGTARDKIKFVAARALDGLAGGVAFAALAAGAPLLLFGAFLPFVSGITLSMAASALTIAGTVAAVAALAFIAVGTLSATGYALMLALRCRATAHASP